MKNLLLRNFYDSMVHGYNICCEERPWAPDKKGRWQHPQAQSAGADRDYGLGINCAQYHCPICGLDFEVELPQ